MNRRARQRQSQMFICSSRNASSDKSWMKIGQHLIERIRYFRNYWMHQAETLILSNSINQNEVMIPRIALPVSTFQFQPFNFNKCMILIVPRPLLCHLMRASIIYLLFRFILDSAFRLDIGSRAPIQSQHVRLSTGPLSQTWYLVPFCVP